MPEFRFDSIADFFAMGGYGFYVWVSYGFFAAVMGFNLWLPYRQRANTLRLLQARQLRQSLLRRLQRPLRSRIWI